MNASVNADMYFDAHIAELYDRVETQMGDVELLRRLIGAAGSLKIFEPFCGTGRILIPLACDGHALTGLDISEAMLERAEAKIDALRPEIRQRIALRHGDVLRTRWPEGCDLVVLGGNFLYELSSAAEQEGCLARAWACLRPGGRVFVDNDHMEGELAESWRTPGRHQMRFPSGVCADGTVVEGTSETVSFDGPGRIWRSRRTVTIAGRDGRWLSRSLLQQKHPVSMREVNDALERQGFVIEQVLGDHAGHPYTAEAPRAIFWARKKAAIGKERA